MTSSPKQWNDQGCGSCRASWESGSRENVRQVGTSVELHSRLYRCTVCGSFWAELERFVHEISAEEARTLEQHGSFVRDTGREQAPQSDAENRPPSAAGFPKKANAAIDNEEVAAGVIAFIWKVMAKHAFKFLLLFALAVGTIAGLMGVDKRALLIVIAILAVLWLLLFRKPLSTQEDRGAWQRRIDREYRLEINESTITLFHNEALDAKFEWRNVLEVQMLRRRKTFPPLVWKIISRDGEFILPNGGRYAREFEKQFIYALPGYYEQKVVKISAAFEFTNAFSMWRANDPYPKRPYSDDER